MFMKLGYFPPILHCFCTYFLCITLVVNDKLYVNISMISFIVSLLLCYFETFVFILPHYLRNKSIKKKEKLYKFCKGLIFNAFFIISYSSEYIYKDKKHILITNLFTLLLISGYLFIISQNKKLLES